MEKVKQKVEELQNSTFICDTYDLQVGTSFDGIPYALFTTKGVWYKVRVIACVQEDVGRGILKESILINYTEHRTEAKAKERVRKCKEEFAKGNYHCLIHQKKYFIGLKQYFKAERFSDKAVAHPDRYIRPGDLIVSRFAKVCFHYGIYIGNGEVVHVSGHGEGTFLDKKKVSVARKGKLCPNFIETGGTLWRIKSKFLFRQPEKVVQIAKHYAENGFRKGDYDLISQNCQHFATLCAFGVEISPEIISKIIYGATVGATLVSAGTTTAVAGATAAAAATAAGATAASAAAGATAAASGATAAAAVATVTAAVGATATAAAPAAGAAVTAALTSAIGATAGATVGATVTSAIGATAAVAVGATAAAAEATAATAATAAIGATAAAAGATAATAAIVPIVAACILLGSFVTVGVVIVGLYKTARKPEP